jgi:hypothetical protein
MFAPGRHEERFFDDAHGDNLYSPAQPVKLEWAEAHYAGMKELQRAVNRQG